MTKKEQAQMIVGKINKIIDKTSFNNTEDDKEIILDLPSQYAPAWESYIGQTLPVGKLICYDGMKYITITAITVLESQPPTWAVNNYQPFQGKFGCNWISREYIEIGFTRYHSGKLYKAIQKPTDNLASPDLVPALWQEITNI